MRARVEDVDDDDDEGFVEGPEPSGAKGKQRRPTLPVPRKEAGHEGLPPQTVLARVLRELEDDFTHYKRLVFAFSLSCTC